MTDKKPKKKPEPKPTPPVAAVDKSDRLAEIQSAHVREAETIAAQALLHVSTVAEHVMANTKFAGSPCVVCGTISSEPVCPVDGHKRGA